MQNTVQGGRGQRHDRRVTDDPEPDAAQHAPDGSQARAAARRSADPRYARRNLASRLSPGPSGVMSRQRTDHIGRLLSPLDSSTPPTAWAGQQARTQISGDGSRLEQAAAGQASPAATPDDIAQLRETLEQQNELLRAILASSVDSQEDARSTAQNSRTFAWAGTAIALLTLIATVVSIIAAVTAHWRQAPRIPREAVSWPRGQVLMTSPEGQLIPHPILCCPPSACAAMRYVPARGSQLARLSHRSWKKATSPRTATKAEDLGA
jgi:hypothetical protein